MTCALSEEANMNSTLMLWGTMIILIALLLAMMLRVPSTFLFDLIARFFSHDRPYRRS